MIAIAAVDKNLGIGNRGRTLVSIPQDRQRMLEEIRGKTVILGRKTLESLPQKQPFPLCRNIVLTRRNLQLHGVDTVHSVEETLDLLRRENIPSDRVYVLGGESVYREFMPWCDRLYLTEIDYAYQADAHFPAFPPDDWECTGESEEQTCFDLIYVYRAYWKKTPARSLEERRTAEIRNPE